MKSKKLHIIISLLAVATIFIQNVEIEKIYSQVINKTPTVDQEIHEEYNHVYLMEKGSKKFISEGNFNDIQPHASEDYIVWSREVNGAGQIFRYHILSESTLQITHTSTNLNPKVDSNGRVVWERWVNDGWQIYLFDGLKMQQISQGKTAINPEIEGGQVVYAKRLNDTWLAQQYDILENKLTNLETGEIYKFPIIKNGLIEYDYKSRSRPLDKVYAEETLANEEEKIEKTEQVKETSSSEEKIAADQKDVPVTVTLEEVEEEIDNLTSLTQNDTPESSSSSQ